MARHATETPLVSTRDRILAAAIHRFARNSYEETGLRDIAADVGVDVAYVHRCFGSKRELFAHAVEAVIQPGQLFEQADGDPALSLVRRVFIRQAERASGEIGPLDIFTRSLTSPEASHVLSDAVVKGFIEPFSRSLGEPPSARAALVLALLTGVGILKNVLRVELLADADASDLERRVARAVAELLSDTEPAELDTTSGAGLAHAEEKRRRRDDAT